jgi:hypothetical protein
MANNSKKSKDPTEVALSAIQDALEMREPQMRDPQIREPRGGPVAQRDTPRAPAEDDLFLEGVHAADLDAPERDERPARNGPKLAPGLAANDDQASIGQILQSLQRQPARTPYVIAGVFSAAWIVCALGLSYSYEGAFAALVAQGGGAIPLLVGLIAGFFAPVVFFFVLAHMLGRNLEVRMISQSMAHVAVRLDEPV